MCVGCWLNLALVRQFIYSWVIYDNFVPEVEELHSIWNSKLTSTLPEPSVAPLQITMDNPVLVSESSPTIIHRIKEHDEVKQNVPEPEPDTFGFELVDFDVEKKD